MIIDDAKKRIDEDDLAFEDIISDHKDAIKQAAKDRGVAKNQVYQAVLKD